MKEFPGRIIGSRYSNLGESIITRGHVINIDRTHYAEEWNKRHGMKPEFIATTNNERFTIWTNDGISLACAIPLED